MAGKISAIGAIVFGLLLAGVGLIQLSWSFYSGPFFTLGLAALLILGGWRTLRKLSGGLRLLCGAWGIQVGAFVGTYLSSAIERAVNPHWGEGSYSIPAGILAAALVSAPLIAAAGLALAVLHKEKKA